jgi:hypothetical protein
MGCESGSVELRTQNVAMSSCLPIRTASPEATARAYSHRQKTEHEIDANNASDLAQLFGGFGECLAFDGMSETTACAPP